MDILNNGMDCGDPLAPIIDKLYTSFESLYQEEQNVYSQHVPQRILEHLIAKIRVKIKKQPILNNEMDILNNGMDCGDPLAPIIDKPYTSLECWLQDEQNVYSQYVPQRILEDLIAKIRVKIKKKSILNNEMDILNNGMDCGDLLVPILDKPIPHSKADYKTNKIYIVNMFSNEY